ncbi:MAG: hypothetical protein AAF327_03125 [Cyanobacteria bacterium P01_A01_bin.37]
MTQFAKNRLTGKALPFAIALASIVVSGCSTLSSTEQTLLNSIERHSESSESLTEQPVFDPFYDAVSTAMNAADQTQVAQTPEEWRAIAEQWQAAIEMMKAVPVDHPKYDIAQQRALEAYPANFQYAQSQAGDQELSDLTATDNKLTEVDFGEGWPFLVDGEITCEVAEAGNYSVSLVTLHSIGEVFAVNSPAQARANERGWLDVRHVWSDSPLGDGKAPMTWVVMRGEALCQ